MNSTDSHDVTHRVAHEIDEQRLETVIVCWPDTNGVLRGKRVPADLFKAAPYKAVLFTDYSLILDVADVGVLPPAGTAGYFPAPHGGYGDHLAIPDLATFTTAPWESRTGIVFADSVQPDGSPVPVAPRQVLKRVLDRVAAAGLTAMVGPELEFFVLRETPSSLRQKDYRSIETVSSRPQTYGVADDAEATTLLRDLVEGVTRAGIPVEQYGVEGGAGQYEINIRYGEACRVADQALLFRHAIRRMCTARGLMATFMPKLFPGFGSGFHVHVSLWDADGRNVFYAGERASELSQVGQAFLAGCLDTMHELAAIFAPTVNAYKRLVPYSYAGTTATWGRENRSAGIRVLTESEPATRIEHRTPGADANPHLVLAAILAGGMHGIDKRLELVEETTGDVYACPTIEPVPSTLAEAASRLETSAVAHDYLGSDFVDHFVATRRHEWQCFNQAVTDWEYRRYLEVV